MGDKLVLNRAERRSLSKYSRRSFDASAKAKSFGGIFTAEANEFRRLSRVAEERLIRIRLTLAKLRIGV